MKRKKEEKNRKKIRYKIIENHKICYLYRVFWWGNSFNTIIMHTYTEPKDCREGSWNAGMDTGDACVRKLPGVVAKAGTIVAG